MRRGSCGAFASPQGAWRPNPGSAWTDPPWLGVCVCVYVCVLLLMTVICLPMKGTGLQ
jgi:hypothetical protein